MDVVSCQGCRDRDRIIAGLQERVQGLQAQIDRLSEQLQASLRAGKRQAAPFSKGPPKARPKRPGRKPGKEYGRHARREPPPPDQIDETYEANLPEGCPDCGGKVVETGIQPQYQTEIEVRAVHRQFNVHVGSCQDCGKRCQGRHDLQTSDALGAAASQLGPKAQAAIVELNKQAGISQGKVAQCFENLFGIHLSRGAVAHVILRVGRRCEDVYRAIRRTVRRSRVVVPDETGWRVGGQGAWLHGLVAKTATVYVIDPTRSGRVAEEILGPTYSGTLIHDGWSPYDGFDYAWHQQCLQHLLCRCREMLQTARGSAARFPKRIQQLLESGLRLRDRHQQGKVSDRGLAMASQHLMSQLIRTIEPTKTNQANERLAEHLRKHCAQLLTFLDYPGLDATNWRAEHAMRFAVVLRKIWGGNRTWKGAGAQAVLMSVWRTCWQRRAKAIDFISQLLCNRAMPLPLPP